MMIWRRGIVRAIKKTWSESLELEVELQASANDPCGHEDNGILVKALAYRQLVGTPALGDTLLLSASAAKRALGTGGYFFAAANLSTLPADSPPAPGHLMKARYTPSQFMVQGVDEQESPYHEVLAQADDLQQMPVVCADLHSALPAIVLGMHHVNPDLRIAYIMSDGAALPVWFSQIAAQLCNDGAILGTISCGQAFGGELEAVNIYTALLAAKYVWHADAAIITQGPGNLGTGTKWGFSGTQIGEAINAVGILKGRAIAALRLSNADLRSRHFALSHHSERIISDIVNVNCDLPIPSLQQLTLLETGVAENSRLLPAGFTKTFSQQLALLQEKTAARLPEKISFSEVDFSDLLPLLAQSPYPLRTMGRNYFQDASAFIGAAVAGKFAANQI